MADIKELIPAIRQVVKEDIIPKIDNLQQNIILELDSIKQSIENHAKRLESLEYQGKQTNDILKESLPKLDKKFSELNEIMCMKILDLDTHRRKWSLLISGLEGNANEPETITRNTVKDFGKNKLKLAGADKLDLAACHRLSPSADAGIIVRFVDLNDRNMWLNNAKNLKSTNQNVSISPDLPPVLRGLKSDILKQGKSLPLKINRKVW